MNNRFKHFFIKQKSETAVIIQCLFETIDESVEEEALHLSSRSLTLIGNLGVSLEVAQWDNHKLSGAGISII